MANPKRAPTRARIIPFPQRTRRIEVDIPPSHRPKTLVMELRSTQCDVAIVDINLWLEHIRA